MKNNTIAIAIAALLVGGVSVAAFQSARSPDNASNLQSQYVTANNAGETSLVDRAESNALNGPRGLAYADVIGVKPVTEKSTAYATVVNAEPIKETTTSTTPREVCEDVVVQERAPERDGNVGGTVAGAVIGGLVGNQVGKGNGRKAATAAGAVAGGFIGNRVDRNHVGGRVVERTDRQCRTVQDTAQSSKTVAYDVTYRNADGTTGSMRLNSKPGDRVKVGTKNNTIGYDVTYSFNGQQNTVRMDEKPGERLPVVDGQVVTQTAAMATGTNAQ